MARLNRAVGISYIGWNPAASVDTPASSQREMRFLSAREVERLAQATPERYRALVYLLAYGGLRVGEAAALRATNMNLLKGTLTISRSVTEVGGRLVEGPTKTKVARTIVLPPSLRQILDAHKDAFPGSGGLVFSGPGGGQLRPNNFRKRVFYPAAREVGLVPPPLRVHDLRHTCAALLIAQGAHVKEIAARLGHKNPNVTLAVYAHILPSLDERLADGLEMTLQQARQRFD
jgi:integrase